MGAKEFMRQIQRMSACLTAIVAVMGLSCCAHAQDQDYSAPESARTTPPPCNSWNGELYHPCELSVEMFGVGMLHEYDFNSGGLSRKNYRFGGGAGLNYFFTRYVGLGGDFYSISWHQSFVDTTTGNIILRLPIANTGLAPYIFGGAGYQFQGIDQVVGGGGAGLEFRPVPHFGIFVDARYLAAAKTDGFGVARAGVQLIF